METSRRFGMGREQPFVLMIHPKLKRPPCKLLLEMRKIKHEKVFDNRFHHKSLFNCFTSAGFPNETSVHFQEENKCTHQWQNEQHDGIVTSVHLAGPLTLWPSWSHCDRLAGPSSWDGQMSPSSLKHLN